MKIVKYISFLILLAAFIGDFKARAIASNALVVISILFGFSSTSFSLIIFSNSARKLYGKTSAISKSSEFYDVIKIYKKIFLVNLISIVILMLNDALCLIFQNIEFFIGGSSYIYNTTLNLIILTPICLSLYLFSKIIELNINFAIFKIRVQDKKTLYD